MNSSHAAGRSGKLRANISIATKVIPPGWTIRTLGVPEPVLLRDAPLPAEATYEFTNATEKSSTIEVYLFLGDGISDTDNVSVGRFILNEFPPAPNGPSQVKSKISVTSNQEVWLSVLEPSTMGYRSFGFVDVSRLGPPAVKPPLRAVTSDPEGMIAGFAELVEKGPLPVGGHDISCEAKITFDEALFGGQKHLEVLQAVTCQACSGRGTGPDSAPVRCTNCQGSGVQRTEKDTDLGKFVSIGTCPTCDGTGQTIPDPCAACEGQGWVKERRPFTLNVPPGIDSGTQICFPGQGEPGNYGGRAGHLYITVTVARHPLFTRVGRDVFIQLPVSAGFAKKGGQLRVPGMADGSFFLLELPANTQPGATFRLYEHESHTLSAILDTYSRSRLFALLRTQQRLRAIKGALAGRDFQV
jgi:hypothetical protein